MPKPPITLFSFGYWGWGNATGRLVQAVDAVEGARGFEPPLFVDTRIRRSVRAKGFDGSAFERLLTPARYQWMSALGNSHILNRRPPDIQIADPEAANDLLELAIESHAQNRRILFFCSCQYARWEGGRCHRTEIAALVHKAAQKRSLPVEIVEWPGGQPHDVDLQVSTDILRKVRSGRTTIPLGDSCDLPLLAGLPWGSIATLHAGDEETHCVVGRAIWRPVGWCLPILSEDPAASLAEYRQQSGLIRRRLGFESQ